MISELAASVEKTAETVIETSRSPEVERKGPYPDSIRPAERNIEVPVLKGERGSGEKSSFSDSERPSDKKGIEQPELKDAAENNEGKTIPCRNEHLEGSNHPDTDIPFERRTIEVNGKTVEGVFPDFDEVSKFETKLDKDMYESSDREQFKECSKKLKEAVENDPELAKQFTDEQLEQIKNGDTPDGYTWHHDAEPGRMQLVPTDIHQKTGHTGGQAVWGGGSKNR